jgi:hypothetical protein
MDTFQEILGTNAVFSDFELINKVLGAHRSLTAREISVAVTEFGVRWDKGHANSVLYKMLVRGLVEKDTTQGTRPYWQIANPSESPQKSEPTRIKVLNKHPQKDEFIPLIAVCDYTLSLSENVIEFALNNDSSPNDPYISCDWLDEKIFVAINSNHPYIMRGISSDLILSEFLLFLALDASCEWRIIRDQNLKQVHSFIEIKDKILRTLT